MNQSIVIRWARAVALSTAVLGCATNLASSDVEAGSLVIQAPTSVVASTINYGGAGFEATLRNSTNQTLYANVGDAFNG
ncbi:MAG: hypothetical protein ABI877_05005, partial [Gemmatimonadaceae bacterium]